ncbi:hypothetical protein [Riemerella anatipestifer]|uniref:Uncharacterized protein n=1 Tax=Riemerella anatipestifer RA-CH-1 TaxID=1228997 RepID=J9RA07_RIEAN|nr:hypothetical protein [Riemerella anatipestifer]AFR36542.1 hypothetical protein B739_1960 [Riemerella anatipestifer RA-CH-1]AIH01336.1 hypothetical protein M949_0165 [Riemerella anatipestifer CH3]MCO7331424.1 hypothetical protein [Riemerella anatipestifer]MCO7350105.1 hypothetical protein [Riemerella anatipestifer]MCU7582220.1 hypothetical protein [Riemerella anatipestifer]
MKTKNLQKVNERVATTLMETMGETQVYYQYETDNNNKTPQMVNFSTQLKDGKTLSGSYSKGGGLSLNGTGVNSVEDLQVVNSALDTILEIINGFEVEKKEAEDGNNK